MKLPLKNLGLGVALNSAAAFSVPNNSFTAVTFDTIVNENFNTTNLGLRPSEIIIPKEGWYIFSGQVTWAANTTGSRVISLVINDTTTIGVTSLGANDGSSVPDMNVTGAWYCQADDYVKLSSFQNSGGSLNIFAASATLQALEVKTPLALRVNRTIGALLQQSGTFALSNNVEAAVHFNTIARDDFGTVNLTTLPDRITIAKEGWYIFFAYGDWANSATGERYIALKLNGSNYIGTQDAGTNGGNSNPNQNTTAAFYCYAGDYIQFAAFQASGGSLNIGPAFLTAVKL